MRLHIDSFTELDGAKTTREILGAMAKAGRFSCFDVTDKNAGDIDYIIGPSGWVETHDMGYPWTGITLTEKGREYLGLAAKEETNERE